MAAARTARRAALKPNRKFARTGENGCENGWWEGSLIDEASVQVQELGYFGDGAVRLEELGQMP